MKKTDNIKKKLAKKLIKAQEKVKVKNLKLFLKIKLAIGNR